MTLLKSTRLGRMLVLYRAAERLSLRQVEHDSGISHATLSRIERGKAMDVATFLKLWDWLVQR